MARGISGNQGSVSAGSSTIAELSGWSLDIDLAVQTYSPYSGGGNQKSIRGNKKATGTIEGFFDPNDPIDAVLNSDSLVLLTLRHNSGKYRRLEARISKLTFGADNNSGDIQKWSASFESDGAITTV